ncbi:hypothetical protein D3C75_809640 [compost metagenome]
MDIAASAPGIDPDHGSSARLIRQPASAKARVEDQHSACTGAAEEFMRREKDSIQLLQRIGRMHIDGYIWSAGGKIHKANSAVAVHGGSELVIGGLESCNVGAGREGADLEAAVPVEHQQTFQLPQISSSVRSGRHGYDIADALLPGQQIGVMLHVADKNNGAFLRDAHIIFPQPFRKFQAHQPLQLIDCAGGAVAAEEQGILRSGIHMVPDNLPGFVIGQCHGQSGCVRFRMRVADIRPEAVLNFAFNGLIQPSAGCPVGIQQRLTAIGGGDHMPPPNSMLAKSCEMLQQ